MNPIGALFAAQAGVRMPPRPARGRAPTWYRTGVVGAAAPAAPSSGASVGGVLLLPLDATGVALYVRGKADESRQDDEARALEDHLERVHAELAGQREDMALARGLGPFGYAAVR